MLDLNDIDTRLKRIYSALNTDFSFEIHQHFFFQHTEEKPDLSWIALPLKSNEIDTKALNIIHHIAALKDHLKKNYADVETTISNTLELQLVIDIDNADKHTYPVTRKRSNLDPYIDIACHLQMSQGDKIITEEEVKFGVDQETGKVTRSITSSINIKGGKSVIDGGVFDSSGNFIISFQNMIKKAIETWENIIKPI